MSVVINKFTLIPAALLVVFAIVLGSVVTLYAGPANQLVPIEMSFQNTDTGGDSASIPVGGFVTFDVVIDDSGGVVERLFIVGGFDPSIAGVLDVTEGADFPADWNLSPFFFSPGEFGFSAFPSAGASGIPITGPTTIAQVTFEGMSPGTTPISFDDALFDDASGGPFSASTFPGVLEVTTGSLNAPTLNKQFTIDPVAPGGTTNLEFTIDNTINPTLDATGISFTDSLPGGLGT